MTEERANTGEAVRIGRYVSYACAVLVSLIFIPTCFAQNYLPGWNPASSKMHVAPIPEECLKKPEEAIQTLDTLFGIIPNCSKLPFGRQRCCSSAQKICKEVSEKARNCCLSMIPYWVPGSETICDFFLNRPPASEVIDSCLAQIEKRGCEAS